MTTQNTEPDSKVIRQSESQPHRTASEDEERLAKDIFPTHLTPGAYVVAHGDSEHVCFGYDRLSYADAHLDRWIQAVSRILRDPELLRRCMERAEE